MRVLLVETPAPSNGSMAAYAELVAAIAGRRSDVTIERRNLAPSAPAPSFHAAARRRIRTLELIARARRALRAIEADVVHVVDGSQAHVLRARRPHASIVVTVHDLIPLLQSRGRFAAPPPGRAARWLIERSIEEIRRADLIIAVSACTARDLIHDAEVAPEKVRVIHSAVRPDFAAALDREEAATDIPVPYILHVGNNGFYKNRAGVLRTFARVRRRAAAHLVMAGPPPDDSLTALVRDLHIDSLARFVVDPPLPMLASLYRGASLFLFPSLYEGFGWPPLEAMAARCPVVASNAGSLPEVVGDAALTADAYDEEALADHCLSILEEPALARDLRDRGSRHAALFTLDRMANSLLDAYREAVVHAIPA